MTNSNVFTDGVKQLPTHMNCLYSQHVTTFTNRQKNRLDGRETTTVMTRLLLLIPAVLCFIVACQPSSSNNATPGMSGPTDTLLVYAAASLTDAFQQIGAAYQETHPGSEINFNFGGSQQLAQQLLGGAPGHLFASADQRQMDVVVDGGGISRDDVRPFAANNLIIIYPATSSRPLSDIADLTTPDLRLVIAAEEVPAGQYTRRFLDNSAAQLGQPFRQQVLDNVVSYELNVRAVLTKVILGEADAGIVYTSDFQSVDNGDLAFLTIPSHLNIQAQYFLAPIAGDGNNTTTSQFIDFILSADGQAILEEHGFVSVTTSPGG